MLEAETQFCDLWDSISWSLLVLNPVPFGVQTGCSRERVLHIISPLFLA